MSGCAVTPCTLPESEVLVSSVARLYVEYSKVLLSCTTWYVCSDDSMCASAKSKYKAEHLYVNDAVIIAMYSNTCTLARKRSRWSGIN